VSVGAFLGCYVAFGLNAFAQAPVDKPGEVASPNNPPTFADQLKKPTSYTFRETKLSEVVESLAKRHDVNILLDTEALKDTGVDGQSLISASVENVSLQTALDLILHPISLDWTVADNVVIVTSPENAAAATDVRIYSVADLVALGFAERDEKHGKQDLRKALLETVAPTTWASSNGTGTVTWFGDDLVVRQSRAVHQQIDNVLSTIKAALVRGSGVAHNPVDERMEHELGLSTKLDFVDVPLRDALDYIAKLHNFPIYADEKSLQAARVDLDSNVVTTHLEGVTLCSALNIILLPMNFGWVVQDGMVKVTSADAANQSMQTRAYFVKHLLSEKVSVQQLAIVIREVLGPDAWTGKNAMASVVGLPDCLIVYQSYPKHREVAELLNKLSNHRAAVSNEKPSETPNQPTPQKP
jgi:hypothetical protein